MTSHLTIDGSQGEGGGQILRSSLALSMITGRPFRIENIRSNREKPGLLRQHLAAVRAAAEISSAKLEGAELGSRKLTFSPGSIRPGNYKFSVGSAGSTTLVLQAILPALLCADSPSQVTLEGGTHNPFAPPFDFLNKVFFPIINRMGPNIISILERAGFFPAGGGRYIVVIQPAAKLNPISILDRGEMVSRKCIALVAGLPQDIADRELALVSRMMNWPAESFETLRLPQDQGPGNLLEVILESQNITELFTTFGTRGLRAEAVADTVLQQTKKYLVSGAPIGQCLADQLILPFALAGSGSFVTQELTRHTTTNIEIVRKFLPVEIEIGQASGRNVRITFKARTGEAKLS